MTDILDYKAPAPERPGREIPAFIYGTTRELRALATLVEWFMTGNPLVDDDQLVDGPDMDELESARRKVLRDLARVGIAPFERRDD